MNTHWRAQSIVWKLEFEVEVALEYALCQLQDMLRLLKIEGAAVGSKNFGEISILER